MTEIDAFSPDNDGLARAVELLVAGSAPTGATALPTSLPEQGLGPVPTMERLAGPVLHDARDLGGAGFFAHMDPPTPWISWAMHLWTASRNQNLLHPDTAPVARDLESRVIAWIAPFFRMGGGHLTPGGGRQRSLRPAMRT